MTSGMSFTYKTLELHQDRPEHCHTCTLYSLAHQYLLSRQVELTATHWDCIQKLSPSFCSKINCTGFTFFFFAFFRLSGDFWDNTLKCIRLPLCQHLSTHNFLSTAIHSLLIPFARSHQVLVNRDKGKTANQETSASWFCGIKSGHKMIREKTKCLHQS